VNPFRRLFFSIILSGGVLSGTFAQSVWTPQISSTGNDLNSVTWTGSQFVAVGASGTIVTSPNGISWVTRVSGTKQTLGSVTWTGSQLVTVGDSGTILTSPNGINWTLRNSGTTSPLTAVIWGDSQLVAAGPGAYIMTSLNGITWTPTTSSGAIFALTWADSGMSQGDHFFVAVGQLGQILYSPFGTYGWSSASAGTINSNLYGVTWADSSFVAVGSSGYTAISTSGIAWKLSNSGQSNTLYSVIWTGTRLVAVGAGGVIVTSFDGIDWTIGNSGTSDTLNSVVATGTQVVAVGASGLVLSSPQISTTAPGAPTGVTGTPGNEQVSVSWTAAPDNGSAITGYLATAQEDTSKHCSTTGALNCTVSGLTNGVPYGFTVTATNSIGTGPASSVSQTVIPTSAMGIFSNNELSARIFGSSLNLILPVFSGSVKVSVTDIWGRLLWSDNVNEGTREVSIGPFVGRSIQPGVYLLRLVSQGEGNGLLITDSKIILTL